MKPLWYLALVVAFGGSPTRLVQAAPTADVPTTGAPTVAAISAPSPADQKALEEARSLMRISALWNKPLDWNESESPLATVTLHIKTSLGAEAPLIEVRGRDDSRSSFVLEASPLGPTLSSVAELAGFQVWVFPERILLAPQKSLTEDERQTLLNRMASEWKQSSDAIGRNGWSSRDVWNKAVFDIVGREIKTRVGAKGAVIPTPPREERRVPGQPVPPAYELPLGELSPASQQLLQELVNRASPRELLRPATQENPPAPPVLAPTDLIGFDDTNSWNHKLAIARPQPERFQLAEWNLDIRAPLTSLRR